jgi:MSHA biogenesis protein MshI
VRWLGPSRKRPGWLAMSLDGDQLALAHGVGDGARPRVEMHALCPLDAGTGLPIARLRKELALKRRRCALLLKPGEYQVLLVEAPKVAAEEVRQAVRWSVKDLLDHPLDEVTIDLLDVPVVQDDPLASHSMYVVAAPNMIVRERVAQFEAAKLRLDAIDVPETAQRNIAALYEEGDRSVALLHIDDDGALLTITHRGELYYTRRVDVTLGIFLRTLPHEVEAAKERLLLELQRSLDHFERQYRTIPIGKLVLGPVPADIDLDIALSESLGISIESVDLHEVIDFDGARLDTAAQARIFLAVGASLRTETVS